MKGHNVVSDFVKKYGGSEEELLRWYYCSILNSAAVETRRKGGEGKLGDRYILVPKIRAMEKCLSSGYDSGEPNGGSVEGFFESDAVKTEGLSLEGFAQFVEKLDAATERYGKDRGLLDLEWRN